MQVRKRAESVSQKLALGLARWHAAAHKPTITVVETRGLQASVRFFVDYVISVAVNSVARQQAYRTALHITAEDGLNLKVLISMSLEAEGSKFVAYSGDSEMFIGSGSGLFVVNETPRELEHSIYLYLSERLVGQKSVNAEIHRETHSPYPLPVLAGSSIDGPRSLNVRAAEA